MARFDWYRLGQKVLLDVQSPHLYALRSRVVVPLLPLEDGIREFRDLTPVLVLGDERRVMMTPMLAAIPSSELRRPLGNLLAQSDEITRALGILLTGF